MAKFGEICDILIPFLKYFQQIHAGCCHGFIHQIEISLTIQQLDIKFLKNTDYRIMHLYDTNNMQENHDGVHKNFKRMISDFPL